MGYWSRASATEQTPARNEVVIDLREGEARYEGVKPPSIYGYDAVLPAAWKPHSKPRLPISRREAPSPLTRGSLPRRFRLLRRFPPMQRIVHHGPITGAHVDVKITIAQSMRLHSTGIEHPMSDLEGRVRDRNYLKLLTDSFGRDRTSLGVHLNDEPRTLEGAKRYWHQSITARSHHGFALSDKYLVLLEYLPPERDMRRANFGIAYKRIVIAYQIDVIS